MAERTVVITIKNNLKEDLVYLRSSTEHGKFEKRAPGKIKAGGEGTFIVTNRKDAMIGPEGQTAYSVGTLFAPKSYILVFKWNHPWSSAKSAYDGYTWPEGKALIEQSPRDPTGHRQEIEFEVNKL